ncbi:Gfo/Idh/MocA family oxidoreductase [Stigmatella sp. ncwal1]|uniref:Gfo/Idh/MocA family oxidoreductase n=1 Tax=Stigmatella ashevillensis TaxID=2995309 RepID=A0ABT5D730_9BACT|nr:Gfo/Idh/MocA family oxidoreductase [Stigmatella ashevillena]MDC0709463.1 Gfo/Idh/MocA family oxidoreductase [Stigmatella ashevillena]
MLHNRRWDSDFLALKALLSEGSLGRVVHVESRFDRFHPEVHPLWRERAVPGAGVWFDLGPHLVDQMLQLFGLPDTVVAMRAGLREGAQVDDWCHVSLVYPKRYVVLQASMLVAGAMPRFAVHGTRGSWLKHGMDTQRSSAETAAPRGDYRHYYAAILEAVRGRGPNPVTPAQAVAVAAVLEAAVLASTRGCAEQLDLTHAEHDAFLADGVESRPPSSSTLL